MHKGTRTLDPKSRDVAHRTVNVTRDSVRKERAETEKILSDLELEGVPISRPKNRGECPTVRPCPFVGCRYHLWADPARGGGIKINFEGVDPTELMHSCALDMAEAHPDGLTLDEVGGLMNLTRERVRQIESKVLSKLAKIHDLSEEELVKYLKRGK